MNRKWIMAFIVLILCSYYTIGNSQNTEIYNKQIVEDLRNLSMCFSNVLIGQYTIMTGHPKWDRRAGVAEALTAKECIDFIKTFEHSFLAEEFIDFFFSYSFYFKETTKEQLGITSERQLKNREKRWIDNIYKAAFINIPLITLNKKDFIKDIISLTGRTEEEAIFIVNLHLNQREQSIKRAKSQIADMLLPLEKYKEELRKRNQSFGENLKILQQRSGGKHGLKSPSAKLTESIKAHIGSGEGGGGASSSSGATGSGPDASSGGEARFGPFFGN